MTNVSYALLLSLFKGVGKWGYRRRGTRKLKHKLLNLTMKEQPNFEKVKTYFYNEFTKHSSPSERVWIAIFKESFGLLTLPQGFHNRLVSFNKDFNTWLNGLDIRQTGTLIQILKEIPKPQQRLPTWIKAGNYVIDYNNKGHLDLLRTT